MTEGDKSLAKLAKRKWELAKINNVTCAKEDVNTDTTAIQRTNSNYFENLYSNILENLNGYISIVMCPIKVELSRYKQCKHTYNKQ
jgi:hypothetical protein